jgi:hypothetical protein
LDRDDDLAGRIVLGDRDSDVGMVSDPVFQMSDYYDLVAAKIASDLLTLGVMGVTAKVSRHDSFMTDNALLSFDARVMSKNNVY